MRLNKQWLDYLSLTFQSILNVDIAIRSRGLNVNEKREEREVEEAMLLMSTSVQRGNLLELIQMILNLAVLVNE